MTVYKVVWANSFGEPVERAEGTTRLAFRSAVQTAIERRRIKRSYAYQLQCPPEERDDLVDDITDLMARLIRPS
ncbi:hypothetical protein [Geminicoccus flavidas]|uniref:hypothetical protein n=1 Tax=Geminicoccus flavidas TaxID=2506407 RepID=UPI00135CA442|nr:hypothetical protein [Geminicoccus flavidas]